MYASLMAADLDEELHLLRDGKTRSTTGSVVSSLYHLKDIDNTDAGFFVFPDLSVRMEGSYRLKLSLFEIIGFPGMEESTRLSRSFADQGLKIRIRKELRQRRKLNKRNDSDGDASAVEDCESRFEKRPKKFSTEQSNPEVERATILTIEAAMLAKAQRHNINNLQNNTFPTSYQNLDESQKRLQQLPNECGTAVSYGAAMYRLQPTFGKKVAQSSQLMMERTRCHVNETENGIPAQQSNAIAVGIGKQARRFRIMA
ncbi:hypothetical protein DFQ28_007300 [Apophysomyces sp. BC1034]|nr:hypothetical protein DFQ29_003072 [Apophysomyces sp. BC1021]KAG0186794.1 hypothetical protein DFQ28_007300 [Apophysomyces sp. BC1034]